MDEDWPNTCTVDVGLVAGWWSEQPYSVLVVCGHGVDTLELPARSGARVLAALADADVFAPAMLTPTGQLVLFVATGPRPGSVVVSASWRSVGSWVAVPPTGHHHAGGSEYRDEYRWVPGMSPDRLGWALPALHTVYRVIAATAAAASGTTGAAPALGGPR